MIAIGMNGEPLPARARLPGPDGGARPLRLHQRLQVDQPDDADDVRRPRRRTGPSATGPPTRRSRSRAGSTPPRCSQTHQGRRHLHRRRSPGRSRRRRRHGRGAGRRRRLAGGDARPERRQRLLAPVVPPVGRPSPASTSWPAAPSTARATSRPTARTDAVPRRAPAASRRSSSPSPDDQHPDRGPIRTETTHRTRSASHHRPEGVTTHEHHAPTYRRLAAPRGRPAPSVLPPAAARHDSAASDHTAARPRRRQQLDPTTGSAMPTTRPPRPSVPAATAVPSDGDGSFNGMATDPVATAASANPVLIDAGRRRSTQGRPGRHPELRTEVADRLRADQRRLRQDPAEDAQGRPRRPGDADRDPDPPRGRRQLGPDQLAGDAQDPRAATRSPSRATQTPDFTVDGAAANVDLRQRPDRQRHRLRHRLGADAAEVTRS